MNADSESGNRFDGDGSSVEKRLTRFGNVRIEAYPDSTGRHLKKGDIVRDESGFTFKVVNLHPNNQREPFCTLRDPEGGSLRETHGAVAPTRPSRDLTWQSSLPPAVAFNGPVAEPVKEPMSKLLPVTDELAGRLYVPRDWLQEEIVDLLEEKRQLIFYGPPGTGKTFAAQRIAEHLTREGGAFELVQFHPSYSYEDFFEGYRPVAVAEGTGVAYKLTDGPLRRMATAATEDPANPYVLVVDEINRGNLPKIFGELLFLLEYRDTQIRLQYSPETPFGLPENLYFIGTMNTADRSIALVDAALRRRFYFVAFMPTQEPLRSVLAKWLRANGLAQRPAQLLRMLNKRIANEEIAIGPSYLMTRDGTPPNLGRVWQHAILPVLEEHFYATGRDFEAEFGLEALDRAVRAEVTIEAEAAAGGPGA